MEYWDLSKVLAYKRSTLWPESAPGPAWTWVVRSGDLRQTGSSDGQVGEEERG